MRADGRGGIDEAAFMAQISLLVVSVAAYNYREEVIP